MGERERRGERLYFCNIIVCMFKNILYLQDLDKIVYLQIHIQKLVYIFVKFPCLFEGEYRHPCPINIIIMF